MKFDKSFAQNINLWLPTIAIIIGGFWAASTFIYKEVILPRTSPANVTMDIRLNKVGSNKSLTAIEMEVAATNSGSRVIYLLPNIWVASGYNVVAVENAEFSNLVNANINSSEGIILKHATTPNMSANAIAAGRLILDTRLNPNEKVSRKLTFYIPTKQYDYIQIQTSTLTSVKESGVNVTWKLEKDGFHPSMYQVAQNGEFIKLEKNDMGAYEVRNEFELHQISSTSTFSLWQ